MCEELYEALANTYFNGDRINNKRAHAIISLYGTSRHLTTNRTVHGGYME